MRKIIFLLLLFSLLAAVSGCGGSTTTAGDAVIGDNNSSNTPPPPGAGNDNNTTPVNPNLMGGAIQGHNLSFGGNLWTVAGVTNYSRPPEFTGASCVTTDGLNLYITDGMNQAIRKVVIASGKMTTLVGRYESSGSANPLLKSWSPHAITTDGENLYVTGYDNVVWKVVIATGAVSPLAGNPGVKGTTDGSGSAASFSHPQGIVRVGSNLYITDADSHTIRKVEIATGTVTTLAGTAGSAGFVDGTGAAARFHTPLSITSDGTSLYLVDSDNYCLRKIAIATGEVSTIARHVGAGYEAIGMTIAGSMVYIPSGPTILRVDIATGVTTTFAGNPRAPRGIRDGIGSEARFISPTAVTTDGTNLYITDWENSAVRKIAIATAEVTTFVRGEGSIGAIDGYPYRARFNRPDGITTDGANLFVSDIWNGTIRKIEIATGIVTTLAGNWVRERGSIDGTGTSAGFYDLGGITTDGRNVYVIDFRAIRKIAIATGVVTTVTAPLTASTPPPLSIPFAITTDGKDLYVADEGSRTIRKVEIATGAVTTVAGRADTAGFRDGTGEAALFTENLNSITTDGKNLYVGDSCSVRKVVIATHEVTTVAGAADDCRYRDGVGTDARFPGIRGITTDGTDLFIPSFRGLRRITPRGEVSTIRYTEGADGAVTTDGRNVYFANGGANIIQGVN
jgi:hypothetical protein